MLRLVMLFCQAKPLSDPFDIRLGCSDAAGRFFLEHMQHVDGSPKPYRVGRPVRVATVILDNLKDSRPLASPRFRARVFSSKLGDAKSGADFVLDQFGKSQ